jgi:sulfite reductase alpha subunit-like flavoprotein
LFFIKFEKNINIMGLSSFFSSLFGKAKQSTEGLGENVSNMTDSAINKAESFSKDVVEKVGEVAENASHKLEEMGIPDRMENFIDAAKEKASQAADWVEDKAHEAKEVVTNVVDKVEDKIHDVTGSNTAESEAENIEETKAASEEDKPAE